MNATDLRIISYILSYCKDIAEFIAQFGDSYKIFESIKAFKYSVPLCLEQICELSNTLSKEFCN